MHQERPCLCNRKLVSVRQEVPFHAGVILYQRRKSLYPRGRLVWEEAFRAPEENVAIFSRVAFRASLRKEGRPHPQSRRLDHCGSKSQYRQDTINSSCPIVCSFFCYSLQFPQEGPATIVRYPQHHLDTIKSFKILPSQGMSCRSSEHSRTELYVGFN